MIAVTKNKSGLEEYMRGFNNLPILSHDEEKSLFKRVRAKDKSARDILITHNMRFALKVALRYSTRHLTVTDLLSEAVLGLSKAIDKFNPDSELKFITYAVWWIKSHIAKAVGEKDYAIKIPKNILMDLQKSMKQYNINSPELPQELQRVLDLNNMGYLDSPAPGFDGIPIKYTLISQEEAFESLEPFEMAEAIEDILGVFTTKENKQKEVFIRILGLKSGTPETLENIAKDFEITSERVRQIKLQAFSIVSRRYIKNKLGREVNLEKELKYTR